MKRIFIFLLSLILILVSCGCLNNEQNNAVLTTKNNTLVINNSNEVNSTHNNITAVEINNKTMNKKDISNNLTNIQKTKKYDFSKKVDINEMFLNLPYNEVEEDNGVVIKKYCNNNLNVTFEVRTKPIDFSYAYLYNDVKEYSQRDAFGYYTYYEFIPKNKQLPVSYCYYRKVGGYYIVMQTYEKSKRVNDLWINWTKHIFSLFEIEDNDS
ncbi:hypothetical protein ACO3VM_09050 [Methanocaldococcus sp. 10A]